MNRPRICASIVNDDIDVIKSSAEDVDMFEVRIDLIGSEWKGVVKYLSKPWIACNRRSAEGGNWTGDESARIQELFEAIDLGAEIIDVEIESSNIQELVREIKPRTKCLLSYHQFNWMLQLNELRYIVHKQLEYGADICKVIATAQKFEDNYTALQLNTEFPGKNVVAFTMGPLGAVSRVFCPIVGGYFTYASLVEGSESAPGQITVKELRKLYKLLGYHE